MRQYSVLEQRLLNDFQHGLSLSPTPYADLAEELGVDESTVLENLDKLQQEGVVSRVGAVFKPNRVGVSTLAAVAVPESELQSVAEIINGFDEVNHNYERHHHFNLWFVVTASDSEHLRSALQEIEQRCGYAVLDLPMEEDFFIDLGFELRWT
ncbi:MAG: Lrp/AsnC family transcriptional regulator [Gammaproteobacteria bacterium]|nr:Lrp/AsnC family transcriptional regulator [Gammaproteobacteria bacterium]